MNDRLKQLLDFVGTLMVRAREALRSLAVPRHSIGVRLLARVLLLGACVTLILTAIQLYFDYRRDVAEVELRLNRIGRTYGDSLAEGLWAFDERQLRLQLDGILRLPDIRGVEIREAGGSSNPPLIKLSRDSEKSAFAREFPLRHRADGQDRLLGTLRIEATFANVYRRLANTASTIVVTQAVTIFLVSLFIFYFFHHLVTRHLSAIATDVDSHRMNDSPLELHLRRRPPRHEDELQRVVSAFNALSSKVHIAHRDLTEREAKIRRMVDANIVGIFIWDFDGRILEANDEFLRMLGYGHDDLAAGRIRWTDLTPPEWHDLDARLIEEHKMTGRLPPFEKEYFRKDGSRAPVLIAVATFEEGGNQGVAFVLDLTDIKRTENALRASEDRFRDFVDVASDWFWETGPDHRFTEFSQSAADWWLSQVLIGKTRWDLAEDREEEPEKWRAHIATLEARQPFRGFRYKILHPDGSARYVSVSGKPVFDGSGVFLGYRGVSTDVSAEVRAEKALRESEERFRTLMQFSFDVYWETDAQHRFVRQDFSERVTDGPLPGSEIGKRRWELPYLDIDEEAWRKHRETLDAHLPFRDLEYGRPTPNGGKRYAAVSGLPMFDEAGRFIGYRGIGRHITERKRIEEALRQREKELREIVETIPAMTVTIAADGRDAFIGKRFSKYSGLSEEQARGSGWKVTVHPDDLDLYLREWRASLASGDPVEFETRVRRADGEYRWFLARAVAHKDAQGNILKWYEVLTDIEDRKRAEAVLRDSEARGRRLVDANIIGVFTWRLGSGDEAGDAVFQEVNDAFLRIVGYDRTDLATGSVNQRILTPPDWQDRTERAMAEMKLTGAFQPYEKEYIRKDGSRVPVLVGAAQFGDTGDSGVAFVLDLTEQKRAEAVIRESEARVRHLIDANIIGIFIGDFDGNIVDANDTYLRLLGYDREDLLSGRINWVTITPPELLYRSKRALQEMKSVGKAQLYEKEYIRKDGSRVPALVGATVFGEGRGLGFVLDLTEQKRAEAVLRERELRIHRLFDANIIGILISDFEGRVVEANDAFLGIVGYGRDDLIAGHISLADMTPPEWRELHERSVEEINSSGTMPSREKEYFRKDGSRVPVLVGGAGLEEGGKQSVGFVIDLTEQKRAEKALRERDATVRGLVDANIIGTFTWRLDKAGGAGFRPVFQEVNDAFLRIVGYEREDLAPGTSTWILTPPDWVDRTQLAADEMQLNGAFQPYEKVFIRKDGSRVPVLVGAAQTGDTGIAFVVDLTDQKRAEAALRESEEQWKAVFENNPIMYFMVGETGAILSVNPFGAEQLGYTVDELVGRPVTMVFYEPDRGTVLKNAAMCFQRPGQAMSWELRKVRKNGEMIWVRETARATVIKDRVVLLIVCENITEGKRATEALREVQTEMAHANRVAALGQLTASIAHEVQQPVTGALSSGHAALRWLDKSDLEAARRSIERVIRDTTRAGEVISGVRTLIKKAPPRSESFDMNEAIREVIVLTHGETVKSGVSVELQLSKSLPRVQGDRVPLQQVLLNLVINAIEAMTGIDTGPRELLIRTAKTESDSVSIAVQDSGPGIDPANVDRAFEAFYTTKPDGLGMGLSICRSIVEAHGGKFAVTANVPRGAIFQFTIRIRAGD